MFRVYFPVIIFLICTICGCGLQGPAVFQDDLITDQHVESERINEYRNEKYGYKFNMSEGIDVLAVDVDGQRAMSADAESEVVFVQDGETNFLTVRVITTGESAHDWLSKQLRFFYPTADAAQSVGELDGRQAIVLRGSGQGDSPACVMVVQNGESVVVITWERDSEIFKTVVESFEFF